MYVKWRAGRRGLRADRAQSGDGQAEAVALDHVSGTQGGELGQQGGGGGGGRFGGG
jgi:hypothetical protein